MKKHVLVFAVISLLLSSCSDGPPPAPEYVYIYPRVSIVSQNSQQADVTVEIEGYDGNLVSGAVVLVSNSSNGVIRCAYNPATEAYNCKLPIPPDGLFTATINSSLSPRSMVFEIFHKQILNKPGVNVFEDSVGNSVLLGVSLDFLRDVQIGWTSSGEGIVYQITIKSTLQTLYESSTESLNHVIPGGTLAITPGQVYYLQVNAQRITGDPFFIKSKNYSASARTGDTISFVAR